MSAGPFDTLSAAQDLESAGIERKHAEAIAKAINHGDERAATKADLADLRADLYRASWMQGAAIVAVVLAAKLL